MRITRIRSKRANEYNAAHLIYQVTKASILAKPGATAIKETSNKEANKASNQASQGNQMMVDALDLCQFSKSKRQQ